MGGKYTLKAFNNQRLASLDDVKVDQRLKCILTLGQNALIGDARGEFEAISLVDQPFHIEVRRDRDEGGLWDLRRHDC